MTILNMIAWKPTTWQYILDATNSGKKMAYTRQVNDITFKPDGTKLYLIWESDAVIYQYSLSTPRDIYNATYDNKSFNTQSQVWSNKVAQSVIFSWDWKTMFVWWGRNTWYVFKYSLWTAWDVSTAQYVWDTTWKSNISSQDTTAYRIYNDGKYLYVSLRLAKTVRRYTMNTARDITSFQTTWYQELSMSGYGDTNVSVADINFNDKWTQMFVLNRNQSEIYVFGLSTPWDLTTAVLVRKISLTSTASSNVMALKIDNKWKNMYIGWYNQSWIFQLNCIWWHRYEPNANTVAYYPLMTDWKEASNKSWLDITTTGITFKNLIAYMTDSGASVSNINWRKTICFWFKRTENYNGTPFSQWNTNWYIQVREDWYSAGGSWWWSFNQDIKTTNWTTPYNIWRMCVITQTTANNWSWSGSMKFYLDGKYYWTTSWDHYLNRPVTRIWWSGNTSAKYSHKWCLSELIFEKWERDDDFIQEYYEKTKWDPRYCNTLTYN